MIDAWTCARQPRQIEARSLYRSLGFHEITPYYELPPEVRDGLVFFRLAL